jgi:hypothetical protein
MRRAHRDRSAWQDAPETFGDVLPLQCAGEFRHRLIGQDDIEALRRIAECP